MIEQYGYKFTIVGNLTVITKGDFCFDMFDFSSAPISGDFVSERLKDAIEEAGLTGWSFTSAEDLVF